MALSPQVTITPGNHGWARNHCATASPSAGSNVEPSKWPPEPSVPRIASTITWVPRAANRFAMLPICLRPYGVRIQTTTRAPSCPGWW
jgi:hypothetical protein